MKNLIIILILLCSKSALSQIFVLTTGVDVVVQLPLNSITLTSSSSTRYQWQKIAGPTGGAIASPTSARTVISGLTAGTYAFRLATATRSDTIRVMVMSPSPTKLLEYSLISTNGTTTIFAEQPDGTLRKKSP